jgi:F-type H+/Na+-transporting ATPase subunit alpha
MSNQLTDSVIKKLEKEFEQIQIRKDGDPLEVGFVQEVRDGVIIAHGLDRVTYGELVKFPNGSEGLVVDLTESAVGIIILGGYQDMLTGMEVHATGKTLSVSVSDKIVGRVVDALAKPVDGLGNIENCVLMPVEKIASGVVQRQSVTVPLHTGVVAIDALVPIGRGQRELIIGDRGTGKTTLCLDTIISQKGQNVVCIYCAIGQKTAKIAETAELLKAHDAFDYTVIVQAGASDPASMQYIAPYSATAIAEYFMQKGQDVLIVYDDLTKHAYAYREISLILRRPAGREAYPGDVFYLHSRLLERACRLNQKYGGGSITALPVIETLENDVSAYIPTNVISITDGQIFLETDLFNSGVRPAINVGLSVSRVGGSAQTKAMKQVAGKLKLDLAQYRELAAFSQFDSDLDPETKKFLNRGARATEILKQTKHNDQTLAHEVVLLWALAQGHMDSLSISEVSGFKSSLFQMLETRNKKLINQINTTKNIDESIEGEIRKLVESVKLA